MEYSITCECGHRRRLSFGRRSFAENTPCRNCGGPIDEGEINEHERHVYESHSKNNYKTYAKCKCGKRRFAWQGSTFFAAGGRSGLCECGEDIEDGKIVIESFENTAIWYKPSTWGTGIWHPALHDVYEKLAS